jgi:hypothetical protein
VITFESRGDLSKTDSFLKKMLKINSVFATLEGIAKEGVTALANATPRDSGQTAASWGYEITQTGDSYAINWTNSHMAGRTSVAIILQYGHGTGTGGYVQGRDYINPAIQPIMDKMAEKAWKAVTSA